jgi:hypothetical protein
MIIKKSDLGVGLSEDKFYENWCICLYPTLDNKYFNED